MPNSQNGWPVVGSDTIDTRPINGHVYPNGFLKGDVYRAFVWLFTQLDQRVEKVSRGNPPDEWGYYVKKIEGSSTISNHASGTAGDYNASEHPMGVPASRNYSSAQIAEIHKILREANGIFRWGGDYTGRPDPMHFEIDATPNEVHAFLVELEGDTTMFVKKGDSGSWVLYWQNVLILLGFNPGDKDGIYGPKMEAAVNTSRAQYNEGPNPAITEWHAAVMHRDLKG